MKKPVVLFGISPKTGKRVENRGAVESDEDTVEQAEPNGDTVELAATAKAARPPRAHPKAKPSAKREYPRPKPPKVFEKKPSVTVPPKPIAKPVPPAPKKAEPLTSDQLWASCSTPLKSESIQPSKTAENTEPKREPVIKASPAAKEDADSSQLQAPAAENLPVAPTTPARRSVEDFERLFMEAMGTDIFESARRMRGTEE